MQMAHAKVIIMTSDPVISQTDVSPNEFVNFVLKVFIIVCKKPPNDMFSFDYTWGQLLTFEVVYHDTQLSD